MTDLDPSRDVLCGIGLALGDSVAVSVVLPGRHEEADDTRGTGVVPGLHSAPALEGFRNGTCVAFEAARVLVSGHRGRLVVAIPDDWSDHGLDGVRARETLSRALPAGVGFEVLVERSVAIAASGGSGGSEPLGRCLVVDVGAGAVTAAWCEVDAGTVHLVDSATCRASVPGGSFDRHMAAVASHRGCLGACPAAEDLRLASWRALEEDRQRAEVALSVADSRPWFREATAYRVAGSSVTAGEVLDGFAPLGDAVRDAVGALFERLPALVPPPAVPVLSAGDLGDLPPARAAVMRAVDALLGSKWRAVGLRWPQVPAAAMGAARLARGDLKVRAAPGGEAARLLVHRIDEGRWDSTEWPANGVSSDCWPDVEVDGDPDGAVLRLAGHGQVSWVPGGLPIQPGRYQVVHWPNRRDPGGMVLTPAEGGPPALRLLTALPDAVPADPQAVADLP